MMRPTPLDEIRQAIHGRWMTVRSAVPVNICRVSIDTRTAGPGDLFIAIQGRRSDGHEFLARAADAGCVAAVVRTGADVDEALARRFGGGLIGVADTTVALGELAALHRRQFSGQVIAVTGSVGKTTVKEMIHHILRRRRKGSAAPKSYNNQIGVPLTLLGAGNTDEYVVCELGSSAPGEIAAMTHIARPDLAVITAVGPSHLERLGSVERVAAEKAAVLGGFGDGRGLGVVWADSEALAHAVRSYDVRLIRFGQADHADLRLTGWTADGLSQRFQVNDHLWVDLPVPGRHNAVNALAALAVAMRLGFNLDEAASAIGDYDGAEMRMQVSRIGTVTLINDAYNANPMSMAAALEVLAAQDGRRRVFVAGDMLELGPGADEHHLDLGRKIAAADIDLLVAVGPLGRRVARGAEEAGGKPPAVRHYRTAAAAAKDVGDWLGRGDVVLVKASRAIGAERIADSIAAVAGGPAAAPRQAKRAKTGKKSPPRRRRVGR